MNVLALNKFTKRPLNAEQLASVAEIEMAFKEHGDGDQRKLAYMLAMAFHESRLRPIKEIKAKPGSLVWEKYQKHYWHTGYYGRGLVQISLEPNYRKLGTRLNIPLAENPDLALIPHHAADILVIGMLEGLFTGAMLGYYVNSKRAWYYKARATVGAKFVAGQDVAQKIKNYTLAILAG